MALHLGTCKVGLYVALIVRLYIRRKEQEKKVLGTIERNAFSFLCTEKNKNPKDLILFSRLILFRL